MEFTRDNEHIQKGLFLVRTGIGLYFLGYGIIYIAHSQLSPVFLPHIEILQTQETQTILSILYGSLWVFSGVGIIRGIKKAYALSLSIIMLTLTLILQLSTILMRAPDLYSLLQETRSILIYIPLLCTCIALKKLDTYDNHLSSDHHRKTDITI